MATSSGWVVGVRVWDILSLSSQSEQALFENTQTSDHTFNTYPPSSECGCTHQIIVRTIQLYTHPHKQPPNSQSVVNCGILSEFWGFSQVHSGPGDHFKATRYLMHL